MEKNRICVLVVTYNRKEYLVKLLPALATQTHKPEEILLFDNHSTDHTLEYLQEFGYVDPWDGKEDKRDLFTTPLLGKIQGVPIRYYENHSNEGGSGGFHHGLRIASERDCDCIWMMDDDVLPEPDCLEGLLSYMTPSSRICVPSRQDENYRDYAVTSMNMTNPFLYKIDTRKTRIPATDIEKDYIPVIDMPFEGPLLHKSVVEEVGLPKRDLFIIFDDTEFAHRAGEITEIRYIRGSILHRQVAAEKKAAPKPAKKPPMNWKDYYFRRNEFWFDHTYGKNFWVRNLRPFLTYWYFKTYAIVHGIKPNLRLLKRAYKDGMHGRLGKKMDPATGKYQE